MINSLITHKLLQFLGTLAASLLLTSTALALDHPKLHSQLNALLNGDYAFSLSQTCVQTAVEPGFDRDTGELLAEGQTVQFVDSGILHFNGNGNLTIPVANVIQFNVNQMATGQIPVISGLSSSCEGTYQVNRDRSYTTEFTCTADLGNGLALTITPFRNKGQIGFLGQTLNINGPEGNVETVTISSGDHVLQTSERICIRNGTLIKTR